jgi:acyl transferase domain-containing protein
MGWYSTLYTGGSLDFDQAFRVVETMGWHQKDNLQGGQVIYPVVDGDWRKDAEAEENVLQAVHRVSEEIGESAAWVSIHLGGFFVLAGTDAAVKLLLERLPKVKLGANEYPFQLARHSAFHTPLMSEASNHGHYRLASIPWASPRVPMIDGTGRIWRPYQTEPSTLRDYTLTDKVVETFDFTTALRVAIREYNPDHLVLLGPGETLGGAIAHVIIDERWRGIDSKRAFTSAQSSDHPPLISMNRPDQAEIVI